MKSPAVKRDGPSWKSSLLVLVVSLVVVAVVSHIAAKKFGLQTGRPTYRRIGPAEGPQILCAGSSLLQFGLSWPQISQSMGQGIECWAIGGSSPDVWEQSQYLATNANVLIVGFSAYDLNEERVCDSRANIVPFGSTIREVWNGHEDLRSSRRLISQYPLVWLRELFPTAGKADSVLVGLRRTALGILGRNATSEEKANAMVLPSQPTLDFGASVEKLSDWPVDKTMRRLALIRNEISGRHRFDGIQQSALRRMIQRASAKGRVIAVLMPVAPSYARELFRDDSARRLDQTMTELAALGPNVQVVRLDNIPALNSDEYFSDLIHLNGAGRTIATDEFLRQANLARRP